MRTSGQQRTVVKNKNKVNKINKTEILTNIIWTAFGILGAIKYYNKKEYLIFTLMSLIATLYAYKLITSFYTNEKN